MTHRGRILLATALLLCAASFAHAGVSLLGGLTAPAQNFGDFAKPGPHLGLEITVPIIPSFLQVGGQASISRNAFDKSGYDVAVPEELDATWYTVEAMGLAKLYVPMTGLHARLGLGLTAYRFDGEGDEWPDYDSENKLVGAFGAGMSFTTFEINAMYHVVRWDDDAEDPETLDEFRKVDTSWSFFTLSAAFGF